MGCRQENFEERGRYEDRGRGNCSVGGRGDRNCVRHTVRKILDAQRQVQGNSSFGCENSCEVSIDALLSPTGNMRETRHDTIPFMLICKDSCKTFVGSGFIGRESRGRGHFSCVESPILKVRGFVRGSDSCVRVELLEPVYHRHDRGDGDDGDRFETHHHNCGGSVCNFFQHRHIRNFRYTGVCITIDLNCFCGISCLDPITPEN